MPSQAPVRSNSFFVSMKPVFQDDRPVLTVDGLSTKVDMPPQIAGNTKAAVVRSSPVGGAVMNSEEVTLTLPLIDGSIRKWFDSIHSKQGGSTGGTAVPTAKLFSI